MALIINGERVEDEIIKKEVERLRPDYEKAFADMTPDERETQLVEWSKENVIERTLFRQELKRDCEKIPSARIEKLLAELKKKYKDQQELYKDLDVQDDEKLKETLKFIVGAANKSDRLCENLPMPSKDDIQRYYQENKERFEIPEQLQIAQIIKFVDWRTDEATALAAITKAYEEIKSGVLFEKVAVKYTDSDDQNGGMDYIIREETAEEFDDVVFNLNIGQISDIFRTRFGFHIVKVYARKPAVVHDLKEVRPQVIEGLKNQMRENAMHAFLDHLKSEAQIEEV